MERYPSGDLTKDVLETFDRLLGAVTRAVDLARRDGSDEVREWAALAALDAIDLGELLGVKARWSI